MPMMFFYSPKKVSAKNAVNTVKGLSHPLHCFLAACGEVFNYSRFFGVSQKQKKLKPTQII